MQGKLFLIDFVDGHENMSHVTCLDVLLARECLVVVTFILGFMFQVWIHVYSSHS